MRKNRVPFFSKSYCREMLREFSTTGIVFASIEFVASMLSFLGLRKTFCQCCSSVQMCISNLPP